MTRAGVNEIHHETTPRVISARLLVGVTARIKSKR
jgi:hypothetical protein